MYPTTLPAGVRFGHVPSAEQNDFTIDGIVSQRTSEHRRRRVARLKVGPAALGNIVGSRQSAGEVHQRVIRARYATWSKTMLRSGRGAPSARLLAAKHGPLASGGYAGVRSRAVGQGQPFPPEPLPGFRQMTAPTAGERIEGYHVVFRDGHQRQFLEQLGIVVHESPAEECVCFRNVADRAAPARAGWIALQFDPAIRRQLRGVAQNTPAKPQSDRRKTRIEVFMANLAVRSSPNDEHVAQVELVIALLQFLR